MSYDFTPTAMISAVPKTIYDAWLDRREHTEMTGGEKSNFCQAGSRFEITVTLAPTWAAPA
jgi:hypothetical protein